MGSLSNSFKKLTMVTIDENEITSGMYLHLLWSTKSQQQIIPFNLTQYLYNYIYDLALSHECHLIGGQVFTDHVQLIVKFSPDLQLVDMVTNLKVGTALLIRTKFPDMRDFEWQKSDFLFTISSEELGLIIDRIKRAKLFHQEISSLLDESQLEYDPQKILE